MQIFRRIVNDISRQVQRTPGSAAVSSAEKAAQTLVSKTIETAATSEKLEQDLMEKSIAGFAASQQSLQAALSQNLMGLQSFATKEMPDILSQQTELIANMNKLSQSIKLK